MNYQSFLESKKHILGNFGFKSNYIPRCAFDFQEYVIEKSVEKGRLANFLDTGLGKTLIQLSICLLYTSPSPRDRTRSRMPSSA